MLKSIPPRSSSETVVNLPCESCGGHDYELDPRSLVIEKLGHSVDLVSQCPRDGQELRIVAVDGFEGPDIGWSGIERELVNNGAKVVLWRYTESDFATFAAA